MAYILEVEECIKAIEAVAASMGTTATVIKAILVVEELLLIAL